VDPAEALGLLGVLPTATRAEVEQAFRARSLACHPDKVAHLDADFQALADRKFRRLLEAFRLLTE
jgi:curved DNA-binding protein CbpA